VRSRNVRLQFDYTNCQFTIDLFDRRFGYNRVFNYIEYIIWDYLSVTGEYQGVLVDFGSDPVSS